MILDEIDITIIQEEIGLSIWNLKSVLWSKRTQFIILMSKTHIPLILKINPTKHSYPWEVKVHLKHWQKWNEALRAWHRFQGFYALCMPGLRAELWCIGWVETP